MRVCTRCPECELECDSNARLRMHFSEHHSPWLGSVYTGAMARFPTNINVLRFESKIEFRAYADVYEIGALGRDWIGPGLYADYISNEPLIGGDIRATRVLISARLLEWWAIRAESLAAEIRATITVSES
jgi:hypothetical protein